MPKQKSSKSTPWAQVAFVLAFTSLSISPFLLGGNRAPYESGFAILGWLSMGLMLLHLKLKKQKSIHIPFLSPILFTIVFGLIGLIPWPDGAYAKVYPMQYNWLVYLRGILPPDLSSHVTFRASMNPALTSQGVLRWSATLLFGVVLFRFLQKENRKLICLRIIALLSIAVFATTFLHYLLDIEMVMGLEPRGASTIYAPLINSNHLARLFGLFVFFNLYGNQIAATKKWKFCFQFALMLSLIGTLSANSRAGTLFLLIGLGYIVIRYLKAPKHQDVITNPKDQNMILKVVTIFLILVTLLSFSFFSESLLAEYEKTFDAKHLDLKWGSWIIAIEFIKDFPLQGAGLNALSGGVSHYFTVDAKHPILWGQQRVYFAENLFLDVFAAFGLVGGTLLLLAWSREFFMRRIAFASSIFIGAGIIFIVGAELFDYALVTPCILWLTLILFFFLPASHKKSKKTSLRNGTLLWLLLLPTILYTASLANSADRKKLDQQFNRGDEPTLPHLMAIQTHIPFDANLSFAIASKHRLNNELQKSLKWANYAMLLWPTLHGAHIEAARALVLMNKKEQAMIEYKLALKVNHLLIDDIIDDFSKLNIPGALQLKAIPKNQSRSNYHLCLHLNKRNIIGDKTACARQQLTIPNGEPHHYDLALNTLTHRGELNVAKSWLESDNSFFINEGEKYYHLMSIKEKEEGPQVALSLANEKILTLNNPTALSLWALKICTHHTMLKQCSISLNQLSKASLSMKERASFLWLHFKYLQKSGNRSLAYKKILSLSKRYSNNLTYQQALLNTEIDLNLIPKAKKTFARIKQKLTREVQNQYQSKLK